MKAGFLVLAGLPIALSGAAHAAAADAEAQVKATMREWVVAENKHDAAALDRILDDRFISTFAANPPRSKADFIKGLMKGPVDPTQSQDLTDETVVVSGDTAVTVGTDTFHSATQPPTPPLRYTITLVRRDGHWRALGEHIVVIPAKP